MHIMRYFLAFWRGLLQAPVWSAWSSAAFFAPSGQVIRAGRQDWLSGQAVRAGCQSRPSGQAIRAGCQNWLSGQGKQVSQLVENVDLALPADKGVDPGRVDVGVAEDIGKAGDIFFFLIIGDCKKMSEVVGENLVTEDSRGLAEGFHPVEDVAAVNGSA